MKEILNVFMWAGPIMTSSLLFAHHGTNVSYQQDKTITLNGTVTEWSFSYPHPQIYFDVKDDKGTVQHWGAELLPAPIMMKNMHTGWSKESIKPGDQLTITCNPSKVATAAVCLARKLVVNGKEMPMENPPPGAKNE